MAERPRDRAPDQPMDYWHVHFYNGLSGAQQRIGLFAADGERAERWAWRVLRHCERERLHPVFGVETEAALQFAMGAWRRTVLVQNPRAELDEPAG